MIFGSKINQIPETFSNYYRQIALKYTALNTIRSNIVFLLSAPPDEDKELHICLRGVLPIILSALDEIHLIEKVLVDEYGVSLDEILVEIDHLKLDANKILRVKV